MSDPIDRQAAINFKVSHGIDECGVLYVPYGEVKKYLEQLPSAQRTGRWKVSDFPKGKMKYCSECGFGQYIADERQYGYCPNCGAKMEVEE